MENSKGVFHAKIKKHWLHQSEKAEDVGNGRLYIEGYASTGAVDRSDEVVVPAKEAWEKAIAAFMKNPVLLYMHNYSNPAGLVTEMRIDEGIGFWIKAFISSTQETLKTQIMERVIRAFSVGINPIKTKIEDGIRYITEFELYEVSVGVVPINRETLFNVAKAFRDGSDLYIPERTLAEEVDKLLTQKLAALGLDPSAKLITSSKAKGKAPESPVYKNLLRVLSEIDKTEGSRTLKEFRTVISNE